jgi:1-deoxy-D-xylulose-5-phosphate reductoisomerase
MRLPIQCALAYPDRMSQPPVAPLDLASLGTLHFGEPDMSRFPCLRLAIMAGRTGGTMPAVMAAADEVAVSEFLSGRVGFLEIPSIIEAVMERHRPIPNPPLDAILEADSRARLEALALAGAAV